MSEKRYFIARGDGDYGIYYSCDDNNCICVCDVERIAENTCDRLNEQDKRIQELEKENENMNNVLEDFMMMLNKLQAEPNNKSLQMMAKDMLRMMGKDIMGDIE